MDRTAGYHAATSPRTSWPPAWPNCCEVQVAYAIGVAEPVSLMINTFGTGKLPDHKIEELVRRHFPLKPAEIIRQLDLLRPIYQITASGGHFGRTEPSFTWEKIDRVEALQADAKI